ncbi:MAG: NAD(P)H-dependent glycerol-3-phosphate dehydrogenase [Thermoanaerobaculia bacterium]
MKLSILGAGSWGTALSAHFARAGLEPLLWGRNSETMEALGRDRRHPRRLLGIAVPSEVRLTSDLSEAFGYADTLVLAVPCASMRALLAESPASDGRHRFISTSKGIEPDTLKRMSEIVLEAHPQSKVAALSGPTFAEGVARGEPAAAVIASADGSFALELQHRFSTAAFRFYTSEDLIGVELCGALKNVVAIAAGIVSGLGFGHNTLAALVTRGLAEIERLVRAQGGTAHTVHGLAGIGDLMLTCTGQQSRNRRVGEQIGRGRKLSEVLVEMPEVAEGARTCLAVPTLAARSGVEAPIAEAVVRVLYEDVAPREAIDRLMTRALRAE